MNTKYYSFKLVMTATLIVFAVILSACQPASNEAVTAVAPEEMTKEQILTIGIVGDDPAGAIQDFQPLADYLVKNLAEDGILSGEVVVIPDQASMNTSLLDGTVDLFFESPFGAMQAYEAGAIPVLRRWKSGISEYHTLILARKDSGITSVDKLLGKMIAFEDPGSTSGYLLPKAYLSNLGYTVSEKEDANSPVGTEEMGYFFTEDTENSFAQVVQGAVDAAVIQSDDFDEFPQADKDQLNIVAVTPDVPRHVALVSPLMPQALRDHLVQVLMGMEETEEGQSVLLATEETARFDEFPDGAVAALKALQELFVSVR